MFSRSFFFSLQLTFVKSAQETEPTFRAPQRLLDEATIEQTAVGDQKNAAAVLCLRVTHPPDLDPGAHISLE